MDEKTYKVAKDANYEYIWIIDTPHIEVLLNLYWTKKVATFLSTRNLDSLTYSATILRHSLL